ncbi:MAG: GNAT family N-acetyltransferase [Planctomycetaceae bacterium]|nr:GNAT family N-acetyltransferase [Planctomycetaceae bacterium]
MHDIQVITVESSRDKKQFLEFPWFLYKDDPYWIPPLRSEQKELVNYKHSAFYEKNECQTFLAVKHGKTAGRIAAIVNWGHVERYHENIGFFGFFESIDDQEVADALFDTAFAWLKTKGMTIIRGPVNPSLNHTLGLLIDGFDSSPFFMMTYNPPYYERLIENHGFRKSQDLYSFWGSIDMLPKIRDKYVPLAQHIAERTGAKIRPLDRRHFKREVELFLNIYNRSLTNTWGFVPMSDAELKQLTNGLRYLIVPELASGVEIDGRLVGAAFGLPDYNPRIREIDGRLFPFGFLKMLRHKEKIKRIRILSTNVLPEYQMLGLSLMLLEGLVPKAIEWGIQEAEFSWVLESNQFSRGSLEKGGAIRNKTFRIYDFPEIGKDSLAKMS